MCERLVTLFDYWKNAFDCRREWFRFENWEISLKGLKDVRSNHCQFVSGDRGDSG